MGFNSYSWKNWLKSLGLGKIDSEGLNSQTPEQAPQGFEWQGDINVQLEYLRREPSIIIDRNKVRQQYGSADLGRRAAPRYNLSMQVLALTAGRSFRTQTKNVSLVGCYLQDSLPVEFNRGIFEVSLIYLHPTNQKQMVFMFYGQSVDAPLSSYRVQFVRNVGNSLERLYALFKELGLES